MKIYIQGIGYVIERVVPRINKDGISEPFTIYELQLKK